MLNSCIHSRSHPPCRGKKSRSHGAENLEGEGKCGYRKQEQLEGREKRHVRTGDEVCAN